MLISIITATFNSEVGIQRVISTLKKQTYKKFEWVVIDGGSCDSTLELVRNSGINSQRIISESDSGIYDALNKGLKIVDGDFCMFLHSDDWWENADFLANYVTHIEVETTVLYSNVNFVGINGKLLRKWVDPLVGGFSIVSGWMPPHVTMMVRMKLVKDNLLYFDDEMLSISADYDWILKLSQLSSPVGWTYVSNDFVFMQAGGASNGSIKKYFRSLLEDFVILGKYGFFSAVIGALNKRVRKLGQWFEVFT